jgi:eukaryotic-like serine/threonine-protein kinase
MWKSKCLFVLFFCCVVHPALSDVPSELAGIWTGKLTVNGESADFYFKFEPAGDGRMTATYWLPKTNVMKVPLGNVKEAGDGNFKIPLFEFQWNAADQTINGVMTFEQRKLPFQMTRSASLPSEPVLHPPIKIAKPVWQFKTEGAIWSSPVVAGGDVFFGSADGYLYSLNAINGSLRWKFKTSGAVMGRPTISHDDLYVLSDDGYLYKLHASNGKEIWRFDTGGGSLRRDLPGMQSAAYDYSASAATLNSGRVFIGSADGRMICVDEKTGKEIWSFKAGSMVRSIPAVASGAVYFGSFDHFIYALDEKTGALRWKFDTLEPVTSSPLYHGGVLYIGSRSSDLFALDAATGKIQWDYFYWMSWVESSAVIADDTLYIGSSDSQLLHAIDPRTGRAKWTFDTDGSAWSTPLVDRSTVFVGAVGTVGYMTDHRGGFFAIDRKTGKERWRMIFDIIPRSFVNGVASSPAAANGMVYFGSLDGTFYAVRKNL